MAYTVTILHKVINTVSPYSLLSGNEAVYKSDLILVLFIML